MTSLSKIGILGAVGSGLVASAWLYAQERPTFRVKVDMVVLSFTVTDNKNHYVNGLKHSDFRILEDGILQRVATFAEGNKPPVAVLENGNTQPIITADRNTEGRSDAFVGTNVFVLFDTSNFMYRGFVYAEDAIADFVRGLDRADSVARLHLQPQSFARRDPDARARRGHPRPAQSRGGRRLRRSTTPCC